MNKFLTDFIKILVSLFTLRYIQCKTCPSLSTSYIPMFDNGYYIRSFFKIPYTNLLVINAYLKATEDSSIVYYSDLSTPNGEIINVIQPDYTIIDLSYINAQDKILAMNYDRIVIANSYTLKSEKYLSIPQLVHCQVVDKTSFAIATLKNLDTLTIIKTLDNSKFPNVLNTQNYYSKFFKRTNNYQYLVITVNSYGFFSWSVDLYSKDVKYNGYITPTIVNSTVSADFANRQFTKHSTKDIFFVGAANLEILAFEIVDINTQSYRQQMKLNLYNSLNKFNVNNIVYKLSTQDNPNPLLIIGDGQNIYDLPLTFDDVNKQITIPSWKTPSLVTDKNFTSYVWYEMPDPTDQRIIMSANYTVTLYNYYTHSYSYNLYFGNDWQSRRFLYQENGQQFFAALNFKEKVSPWSIYYYERNSFSKYYGQSTKLPYAPYYEVNNFYRVKYCAECLITKVAESTTANHFMTLTYMFPINNTLTTSLNITALGFKWSDVNINLDPFYYKNQVWVVFGFRNKTADKKYLFTMINMQNATQNVNLTAASDDENSRKSSYAIAALDDPDNLEIIGVDLLGYIYVWDFLQPKTIKYTRKVYNSKDCLNSDIGTLYQANKKKFLVLVCDDMRVLVYDFQKNVTVKVYPSVYFDKPVYYVSTNPLALRAFPSIGVIAIGDTIAGNVFICRFDELSSLFYVYLVIQPGSVKDRVLSIELLKENTIWVQYQYSNLFYALSDCLDYNNYGDCFNCQYDSNFYANYITDSSNIYYGIGTPERPYTTPNSFLTAIMIAQRYQDRIFAVSGIGVKVIVDPAYIFNLPKEFLKFDFSSIIQLIIQSKIENQYALVEYPDIIEFLNYKYIGFQDLKIRFNFNKTPNQCGLYFYNITQNVTLNNIQLYKFSTSNYQQNCFQVYSSLSNISISNLSLQNEDFSTHTFLLSTLYANWIKIQNLSLDNCIFGDDFSILKQASNLIADMNTIKITNSKCIENKSGSVSPLFSAGLFKAENIKISNNNFCNKIIFSSVPTLEQVNYQFSFKSIQLSDNTFITKTSYLFFNTLYTMREKPAHQATFLQMAIYNNTILKINDNDLTKASLIQTNKILTHIFEDITFKNHHEITFSTIEYSDDVKVNKFNCINDEEYFYQIPNLSSGSCLELSEILKTKIQTIRIKYKKSYNYELISLQNKLYNAFSVFEMTDGEFSNMALIQQIKNIYANPITINGQNDLKATFSDCHFFDNSLEVIEGSQTFSTSAIWIENSLGSVDIKDSTFKNSKSNSIYNFMFIETKFLTLLNLDFENSSFDLDTSKQLGGFMYLMINQLKIQNSSFSKSKSQFGSFIYIQSFGSLLNIAMNNTKFSQGHAQVDGGAVYIDIGRSQLQFNCNECLFDNIYTYSSRSSAVGFQKYRIANDIIIHDMKYEGGHFRNIFGIEDNFFTDIFNMKLSLINIKEIKPIVPDIKQSNKQFGEISFQQSTLVNSVYSEVVIQGCQISNAQILNKDSTLPLLISSEFTKVSITDSSIQDGIFVKSAIKVTNGTLSLKNTQFQNIIQQKKLPRLLQVNSESTENDISSLIIMQDSILTVSEETSFLGTKCYNSCTGAVFYLMNTNFDISKLSIINSEAEYGGSLYIQGLKLENKIISSIFQNNLAENDGGAIYLQALKDDIFTLRIENCQILKNNAVSGKGGALFIRSNSQNSEVQLIEIKDSQLIGNIAEIGGGIYEKEISPKILGNTIFKQNVGKTFGNDAISYPTHLRLSSKDKFFSLFKSQQVGNNTIAISNFRSGDTLKNLSFELLNDQDEVIRPITAQELLDYSVQVKISKNERFDNYSMRRNTSALYDQNSTKQFAFSDFDFIGIPGSQATLEFTSDQIYILDKNKPNQYHQDYSFKLQINLRQCIQGEAIQEYNYLTECIVCQPGKYSFDLQECHPCPTGATCAGGAQMVAKEGYWRKTNESIDFLSCFPKENCPGGSYGDNVCFEGHIGALCEECDITGKYWNTSYTKSAKNSCSRCDKIAHNSWFVLLLTLWALVSMALAIRGDIQAKLQQGSIHAFNLRKQQRQKNLSNINGQSQMIQESNIDPTNNFSKNQSLKKSMISSSNQNTPKNVNFIKNLSEKMQQKNNIPGKKNKKDILYDERSGIYIKILTNYFQIVSSIATFNLSIPSGIFELPSTVGQPLRNTMNSLDCLLKNYQKQIPYIYLRLAYSLLLPVAYFMIFLLTVSFIWVFKRKSKFPWYILSTAAMFLIIYVQPDLVAEMIALMSYRQIGDTKYVLANVSYEFNTSTHKKFALFLIAPLLATWVLILPVILFILLFINRENLNKIKIKLQYGFLYKEYKKEAFYWEFIKMIEKICIILSLNFYSTTIIIKALLVFIIIIMYGILSIIIEPYEDKSINTLDIHSTNVCALTVLLGLFIYQNPFPYFYYSSLGVIIVINSLFILLMLKRVVNTYIKRLEKMLQAHIKKLALKIPKFKAYLQSFEKKKQINPEVKEKVQKLFNNYLNMTNEERQKAKINILKQNFKYTLSNMFGDLDETIDQLKNSKSMRYAKKFNLVSSQSDEQNNLLYQQTCSPLLRPIYTIEDNVHDEENQQRRAFARHSVLNDYKFDEITDKPLETEQCEVRTEEVQGNWSNGANYQLKGQNLLFSLNNQMTNEGLIESNFLASPLLRCSALPLLSANSEQVKSHDEDEDNQQKRALARLSVLDNCKTEKEINLTTQNQEQCDIESEQSKIDLDSRDNYQSKEIKLLCSLNNDQVNQDEIVDEHIKEESQIGESQIDELQICEKQIAESQIVQSQIEESQIDQSKMGQSIRESQLIQQQIQQSEIEEKRINPESKIEEEQVEEQIKESVQKAHNYNDDSISDQDFDLVKVESSQNAPEQ